jgi:putative addiction module killer protein
MLRSSLYTIEYYHDTQGRAVVDVWRKGLPDKQASARVAARIERLERGAIGDCKPLRDGVWELRIDYGPGYRVYYSVVGRTVVLLLNGGDKRKQNADIAKAVAYLEEYKRRML